MMKKQLEMEGIVLGRVSEGWVSEGWRGGVGRRDEVRVGHG